MRGSTSSIWTTPRISLNFWPVYLRNFLVWRKLMVANIIGNIAEPLISLMAFGYGLGALVGPIAIQGHSTPYILFIASGTIALSVMNAASFESLYSVFSRIQMQKTWDGILNSPIQVDDIVNAEIAWSTTKAIVSAIFITLVIVVLGIANSPKILIALLILIVLGVCFSCLALVCTAKAQSYDLFTFYFTLFLMPMMFLSGVFFPISQLPAWLQFISNLLPLSAGVALVRPLFIGVWPEHVVFPSLVILVYTVVFYWLAMVLLRKRFSK